MERMKSGAGTARGKGAVSKRSLLRSLAVGLAVAATAPGALAGGLQSSTSLANSIVGVSSDSAASIPYRVYEPTGVAAGQKVPLILYLHGMGERGTDNSLQTYNMGQLLAHTKSGQYASYVLAPQINSSMWFAGGTGQTEAMKLTLGALHNVVNQLGSNVDTSRIYVTGVSMGGMGTWDAIRREPNTFAAAVPMSGGYDPRVAAAIKDVPVWAFHGSADTLVPVQATRDMVGALQAAGGDVKYTEIAGGGHTIWDGVYSDPSDTLYSWLFGQTNGQVVATPPPSVVTLPTQLPSSGSADSASPSAGPVVAITPVPEPSVVGIGAVVGAGALLRRRRK